MISEIRVKISHCRRLSCPDFDLILLIIFLFHSDTFPYNYFVKCTYFDPSNMYCLFISSSSLNDKNNTNFNHVHLNLFKCRSAYSDISLMFYLLLHFHILSWKLFDIFLKIVFNSFCAKSDTYINISIYLPKYWNIIHI
jgi:hypothetical protein